MEQSEDFMKLFNKVKGNMQRAGCTDELLQECEAHLIKDGEKASMRSQCAPSGTEHITSFPPKVFPHPKCPNPPWWRA